MFRSTLIAAGATLLCSASYAQHIDPSAIRPITVPIRDAGVFNWDTKKWVSGPKANRMLTSAYTVFRNDCSWTGGAAFLGGLEHCDEMIETGRLPATDTPLNKLQGSPSQLNGVRDQQVINNYQFGYCTYYANGNVDITIGFYDNLNGPCAGFAPVTGKGLPTLSQQAIPFANGTVTAYFQFGSAAGNPLPGSTTNGDQSCWTVTMTFANNGGFCMESEGDGTWDNNDSVDMFGWSFSHNMPNTAFVTTLVPVMNNGPITAAEPLTGGFGAGAYNLPTGTDAIFGGPCGTGFGTNDNFWMNVYGSAPGIVVTLSPNSGNCRGTVATNCYWFGGWPGGRYSSIWMVMGSTGDCGGCSNRATNYCTAGTATPASGVNCVALISAQGSSSATASSGFFLQATGVPNQKSGLFYYGDASKIPNPVKLGQGSSYNCVEPPVRRSALLQSGGSPVGNSCDGNMRTDLNARWTTNPNQNPGAGAVQYAQLWYRDPQNTAPFVTTARSDAISWTVCP
jgi:hypothetical protein